LKNKNNKNNLVVVGYLARPFKARIDDFRGGFGSVVVPGYGRELTISDEWGPVRIEAGASAPVFTDKFLLELPCPTDELALEITRDSSGNSRVVSWGSAREHGYAVKEIGMRTQYRIFRVDSMPDSQGGLRRQPKVGIFLGNLQEMVAECPRDGLRVSRKDIFAGQYIVGPITAYHTFEYRKANGHWVECVDPRPFPEGQMYKLIHLKDGKEDCLAIGTLLKMNWMFPRGADDPLERIVGPKYQTDDLLIWFCRRDGMEWTEVEDPRPLEQAVQQKKKASDVPRKQIFRSFEELATAPS
jgi:hypothetical protein